MEILKEAKSKAFMQKAAANTPLWGLRIAPFSRCPPWILDLPPPIPTLLSGNPRWRALSISLLLSHSFSIKLYLYFCRKIKVGTQGKLDSDGRESSVPDNVGANGPHMEHKLELFGFDSLVSILGLKRYVVVSMLLSRSLLNGWKVLACVYFIHFVLVLAD